MTGVGWLLSFLLNMAGNLFQFPKFIQIKLTQNAF
jgi:hypothetical protein